MLLLSSLGTALHALVLLFIPNIHIISPVISVLSTQLIGLMVLGLLLPFAVRQLHSALLMSHSRREDLVSALAELQAARAAGDRVLRSMAEPVWVTDGELTVELANDAALRLLGLAEAEVLGKPLTSWADLPDLADRRRRGEGILRTVRGQVPVQVSRAQVGKEDQPRWVFVATDLSRRVEAEARILEAAHAAAEANEAKSHFLANISHELRTPLNAILGYSEMLMEGEGESSPEKQEDLERIHKAGSHLLGLINDILDMSKIEAGKMEVVLERVVLDEVLGECRDTVQPVATGNGNRLRIPGTGLVLVTDRRKLAQVLLNLLSNAAKYTPDGEVWVAVGVGEGVRIAVHDTGRGIAADDLPRLFQPFRQLGDDAVVQPGTGLGLVLVKRLTELLGGRVEARSAVGRGSTFTVWLPTDG